MPSPRPSKYHAIRFVLEEALVDKMNTQTQDIDWTPWFRKVARMFNDHLPDALLDGLSRRCDALKGLCEAHRTTRRQASQASQAPFLSAQQRYDRWIQRRDAGNARAAAERRRIQEEQRVAAKAIQNRYLESQWESMMPVWKKQLDTLEETRRQDMAALGIASP